jgi:hypothetical protein
LRGSLELPGLGKLHGDATARGMPSLVALVLSTLVLGVVAIVSIVVWHRHVSAPERPAEHIEPGGS